MTTSTDPVPRGEDRPAEQAVCDRCSMPAVEIDGVWQHAEAADTVFCAVVMGGAR